MSEEERIDDSRLLQAVQAVAISPAEAKKTVERYAKQSRKRYPNDSDWQHQERVADAIISKYARYVAMVGGASALPGTIPGLGTAISMTGGVLADATMSMKLQVDMCMCIAATFGYDIESQDAQYLSFLIAVGGALEKAGVNTGTKVASDAGVRLLREWLRGAALEAVKAAFRKIGIVFTRKALEKALPFGVGVAIGGGANYALTMYVGKQAKQWFVLDRSMPEENVS